MAADKIKIPVFILAGGLGTRLSEETHSRPKPMVEIGEVPILLHVMRWYYKFGFNDFVICAGYRAWDIKNYFLNYEAKLNHLEIDHRTNQNTLPVSFGRNLAQEKWRVRVLDTGLNSMTGARLAKAFDIVRETDDFDTFALTYGDGVSDIDLSKELSFHFSHRKIGTVASIHHIQSRFGVLEVEGSGQVKGFVEKPEEKKEVINGGFFFFNAAFRKYLGTHDDCILERRPLAQLSKDDHLMAYQHQGFWQPMDTLRDKLNLEELWKSGKAPWKIETPKVSRTSYRESGQSPELSH